MARNKDTMSSKIHALISLMLRRITKKNASTRPWCEFVGHSGGGVWIEKTTKDMKRRVVEMRVMKGEIWRGALMVLEDRRLRT
jgi:hypothetical protein